MVRESNHVTVLLFPQTDDVVVQACPGAPSHTRANCVLQETLGNCRQWPTRRRGGTVGTPEARLHHCLLALLVQPQARTAAGPLVHFPAQELPPDCLTMKIRPGCIAHQALNLSVLRDINYDEHGL